MALALPPNLLTMDRYPPRHLARYPGPRSDGAPAIGLPAGWLALAVVLLALIAAIVASGLGTGEAGYAPPNVTVMSVPAATATVRPGPTSTAPTGPGSVSLLPDPSFETGLSGWRAAAGTRLDRVGSARDGRWAANLSPTSSSDPAVVAPAVARTKARVTYLATVWLRSSRPGTTVQVNVVELRNGRRFAVDSVGSVLDGVAWRRLEVAHDGHLSGDVLAIEVTAPGLPGPASVSIDQVDLRVVPHSMKD